MSLKRKVLYAGYLTMKKSGLIRLKHLFSSNANILAFHRVNDYDNNSLTASIEMFDKLMRTIKQYYHPVSLKHLVDLLNMGNKIPSRTIVITLDDGYRDNLLFAASILKKYDIPATFFVTSGFINTERVFPWDEDCKTPHPLMTWDEVRQLHRMGFEIGAHTVNHANLGEVTDETATQEVRLSKEQIEHEINSQIQSMAIPFGRKECIQANTEAIIKEAGFTACCMLRGGKVTGESNPYSLPRVPIYPSYIEMMMDIDNFLIFHDNNMKFSYFSR